MLKWFSSIFKKKEDHTQTTSPYAVVKVSFDDEFAWVNWPEKEPQRIRWSSIIGIAVETTDEGPFVEDVWWHLAGIETVITYPGEATGAQGILSRLQEFPDFNNERLIEAMTCTENHTFILWDHEGRHN